MLGGANITAKYYCCFDAIFNRNKKKISSMLWLLQCNYNTGQKKKASRIFSIKICASVKIAPNHSSPGMLVQEHREVLSKENKFQCFFHAFFCP